MAINVLVAIGGTGARVAEAYVYAAASGLLEGNTKTLIFVVDKDIDCGDTTRLQNTIHEYQNMRTYTGLDLPEIEKIDWCIEEAMQELVPGVANGGNVTFGEAARTPGTNDALLIDMMHSKEEQNFDLQRGFYGHPSLGAALYGMITETNSFKGAQNTLVDRIRSEVAANGKVRTYLVGSLFGGTGASLLPNIARTLHQDVNIGQKAGYQQAACMVLPYFSFSKENDKLIDFASFGEKSATALKFYAQDKNLVRTDNNPRGTTGHADAVFDDIYLFGHIPLVKTCEKYATGGKDQVHTLTLVEFIAALAGIEFFNGKTAPVANGTPHLYSADWPTEKVGWPQIPNPNAQLRIEQMARFCYAFLYTLYPLFVQTNDTIAHLQFMKKVFGSSGFMGHGPANIPDEVTFSRNVQSIAPFCEKYLLFFSDLCQCVPAGETVSLFTPALGSAALYVLEGEKLQPKDWFCQKYDDLRKKFRPDLILVNARTTQIQNNLQLEQALNNCKFDLREHPDLTAIYRAVYEIMEV